MKPDWHDRPTEPGLWLARDTEFGAGITHWRYAESTPESPKG